MQTADAPTEGEDREKYNADDRKSMAKSGHAMPDGSYPIADSEDLHNAIHEVGRGGSSHNAIRAHIIARAKALGMSDAIPDNWNSDGSLKQANSRRKPRHRAVPLTRERRVRESGLLFRDLNLEGGKGSTVEIDGIPIVYNTDYSVRDMFGEFSERMSPGVAAAILPNADVRFLIDHDPSKLLARTISGTLQLQDSTDGLTMKATVDTRDTDAKNLAIRIERGDISQMSCGFIVADDEWNDDMDQRTIHRFADLLDVSAVTYPASPTTSIAMAQRTARRLPAEAQALLERAAIELRAWEQIGVDRSDVVMRLLGMVVADDQELDLTHAVRLRRVYADVRAGKQISAANQQLIANAVKTLHGVLGSSGYDTSGLVDELDPDHDGDIDNLPEEPAAEFDSETGNVDGSVDGLYGEPLNDPGDQIRSIASDSVRAAVRERRGRRLTQTHRESAELLKEAKLRILNK